MNELWPFIKLYRRHAGWLLLGVLLSVITLLASVSLLSLSGWFITSTAIAGLTLTAAQSFNFFTPGAGVRAFSITRTAARYGERLVSHDATFRLLSWLRGWFFRKLVPAKMSQLNQYRKGDLLNRLVADIDALDQLYLRMVSPLLSAIVVTGLLSLFLSFFSKTIAGLVFVIATAWILLIPILFYKSGRHAGEKMGRYQTSLRLSVLDYLQGMAESKIYGDEIAARQRITDQEYQLNNSQQSMAGVQGVGSALFIAGAGCSALAVLWFGSSEYEAGLISGPVMAMMMFSVLAMFEALMPLPAAFQFLSRTCFSAKRLNEIVTKSASEVANSVSDETVSGNIKFSGVSCGYESDHPVLNDLSLEIHSGEHIAVLGKTGCGKSTLIRLLSRELPILKGRVTLDDKPVSSFSERNLYNAITFVPQVTHVFSGTLRENLQLSASEASDDELMAVMQKTGLDRLAANENDSELPDLWIGAGGVQLSGGEQRRLAVARALLKPAPVLIMDEPGEGLDEISEQQLMSVILDEFKSSTLIMITHKKTALAEMDTVYRMESGELQLIV